MSRLRGDESGSIALTLIWFMMAALMLAIALDSFFGIYIARQQGQTAADAAALALTREITARLPDEVRAEAQTRVNKLVSDPRAQENVSRFVQTLSLSQALCSALPGCSPMTGEEFTKAVQQVQASEYVAAFSRHFKGSLPRDLALKIAEGKWGQEPPAVLRDGLIPSNEDLGCLVQRVWQRDTAALLDAADRLAQANGAVLDRSQTSFGLTNGLHRLVVKRTVHPFGAQWLFQDEDLPQIALRNDARLDRVGERTLHYPKHC